MVEGAVKIEGTVKIDHSDETNKKYIVARRAIEMHDYENGLKYYSEILQEEPNNWEPIFYQAYCSALSCKVYQISDAATSIRMCLKHVINTVVDQYKANTEERNTIINKISKDTIDVSLKLFQGAFAFFAKNAHSTNDISEFSARAQECFKILTNLSDYLCELGLYQISISSLNVNFQKNGNFLDSSHFISTFLHCHSTMNCAGNA